MSTRTRTTETVSAFVAKYGGETANALDNQASRMQDAADDALRQAYCPARRPAPAGEGFIDMTPSPAGWASMAELFGQAAATARAASDAWEAAASAVEGDDSI